LTFKIKIKTDNTYFNYLIVFIYFTNNKPMKKAWLKITYIEDNKIVWERWDGQTAEKKREQKEILTDYIERVKEKWTTFHLWDSLFSPYFNIAPEDIENIDYNKKDYKVIFDIKTWNPKAKKSIKLTFVTRY